MLQVTIVKEIFKLEYYIIGLYLRGGKKEYEKENSRNFGLYAVDNGYCFTSSRNKKRVSNCE